MPHLELCSRYWRISLDDFPIPAALGLVVRTVQLVLLVIVLEYVIEEAKMREDCMYDGILAYLSISVLTSVLLIGVGMATIYLGLKGTMAESNRRESVKACLIIFGILFFCEFSCAVLGIVAVYNHLYNNTCEGNDLIDGDMVTIVSCAVIMQVVFDSIVSCCCYTTYHRRVDDKFIGDMVEDADAEPVWLQRLSNLCALARCCSCTVLGGKGVEEQDIEGAAKLFTLFFHHSGFLDVVPSDVLAGMLLVRVQQIDALNQAEQEWSLSSHKGKLVDLSDDGEADPEDIDLAEVCAQPLTPPSLPSLSIKSTVSTSSSQLSPLSIRRGKPYMQSGEFLEGDGRGDIARSAKVMSRALSPLNQKDRELISDICYYTVYALSSYSIFLAVMYPMTCSCRLCLSCLANCGSGSSTVEGDGCCGHHEAAAQYHTRHKKRSELVYGTFENTILLSPYCVFVDHDKHTVVLSIRGTMSMEDAALDMKIDPVEISRTMKEWGYTCPEHSYTHSGFLESAVHIREHIESNGTIDKLLGRNGSYSHYNLLLVGHSLGAGLATLLAMLLKEKYPKVRAIAYGAPAVTLDQVTAHECKDFVTSVIHGDDCIASLNFYSLTHLRERVLDSLTRAKVNKNYVLMSLFRSFRAEDLLYDQSVSLPGSHKRFVENIAKFKSDVHGKVEKETEDDDRPQLTLPGKIIHFVRHENAACFDGPCSKEELTALEVSQESLLEIKISKTMLSDHIISNYFRGLTSFSNQWEADMV